MLLRPHLCAPLTKAGRVADDCATSAQLPSLHIVVSVEPVDVKGSVGRASGLTATDAQEYS